MNLSRFKVHTSRLGCEVQCQDCGPTDNDLTLDDGLDLDNILFWAAVHTALYHADEEDED